MACLGIHRTRINTARRCWKSVMRRRHRLALEIPDADRHLDHDVPRSEYSDRVLVHTGQSVVFGERVVHTERRDRRGIWRDGAAVYPSRAVSFAADR